MGGRGRPFVRCTVTLGCVRHAGHRGACKVRVDGKVTDRKSKHHDKRDAAHNGREHGLGGLVSPADPRDFQLAPLLAAAAAPPPYYVIPHRPPIIDQDGTSMCIAYSSASDQNAEDRADFGTFVNFDEAKFFAQIGGTAAGAFMRAALDQRLKFGYPVAGIAPKPGLHKIAAYYRVPVNVASIKAAVQMYGGVLLVGPWYHSWFHVNKAGKLPPPDYEIGVHAFLVVGWNDAAGGFKANNSWGTDWANRGKFTLPFPYVGLMLEAWKTRDA